MSTMRCTACLPAFVCAALALAQTNLKISPDLKFEVASIKPAAPDQRGGGIRPAPGGERYVANNVTLKTMLSVAYQVRQEQITGGPDWIDNDRFDMNAKAEKPTTAENLHVMLVNLLAERFQLKYHRDQKEMAMYALTANKDGPKLTAHAAESAADPWIDISQTQFLHLKFHATAVPIGYFAYRLGSLLDRPVVDLTNLQGSYDFDLSFTRDLPPNIPEGAQVNGAPIDTSGPTIFAAIKQQLGLDLKAQKGPVDVIAIDGASKLSSN